VVGQRLGDAVEVAAGDRHTCARLRDGRVSCWGNNDFGQAGDGTPGRVLTPVRVALGG